MCDEICKTCGGDDATAKIARKMGFRPDVAFLEIKKLEARVKELEDYSERQLKHIDELNNEINELHSERP